jgi:hypothetical protein
MQILIIFSVAFLASLLSSMSGAGAAWTLIAARNYLEGRVLDWRLIGTMICLGHVISKQD